jgi:glucosamine--fructose-6-phosphate aminotransferase (isomerizing)
LTEELTAAIDELTRPVDAIKHQAKTVTVGISRSDEELLTAPLVRAALAAGAARERLSYRDLRTLAALDAAVAEVAGSTRYAVEGDPESGTATIRVLAQAGAAQQLRSRTAADPRLRGAKHRVATERQCLVTRGGNDGRTVILLPEVEQGRVCGITLLHVRLADQLAIGTIRAVLGGYRRRLTALADAVMETEPAFDESLLEGMPIADLLLEPVQSLAERWRQGRLQPR